MAALSPTQRAWRGRIEATLSVVGPALDLLLAAGDRLSRVADRAGLESPPPARRVGRTAPGARTRLAPGPDVSGD